MTFRLYQLHFISTFLLVLVLIFGVYSISKTNYSEFNRIPIDNQKPSISIYNLCQNLDSVHEENFPYQVYLQEINLSKTSEVENHLVELDALTKNNFLAQNILVDALTEKALIQFQTSNFDSLNMLLNWADELKIYGKFSPKNDLVFQAISEFWYGYVAENLNDFIKKNPYEKYNFKYRFLAQRCADQQFLPNTGNTKIEKVVLNVIDSNWAYLFHRFWFSTSVFFKIIVFGLGGIFAILSFLNLKYLLTKMKR